MNKQPNKPDKQSGEKQPEKKNLGHKECEKNNYLIHI